VDISPFTATLYCLLEALLLVYLFTKEYLPYYQLQEVQEELDIILQLANKNPTTTNITYDPTKYN
jgi:hypothetical protein